MPRGGCILASQLGVAVSSVLVPSGEGVAEVMGVMRAQQRRQMSLRARPASAVGSWTSY